uniref:F-box domain-containing protein n=1 Tax=Plectus sambesii TaxID=2011161 RepID=A0A914WLA9_9BILA
MAAEILLYDLPDELIVHTFRFLDYQWLTVCRMVEKRFRNLADSEMLWKRLTRLDYKADQILWDCWTYRDFYSQVLHRFRYLPGWWLRNSEIIGGLLQITVEKDGINCYDCIPAVDGRFYANESHLGNVRILRQNESANGNDYCVRLNSPDVGNYYKLRKRRLFTISYLGRRLRMYCHQSDLAIQDGIFHRTCKMCTQTSNHDCELICPIRGQRFIEKLENGGFRFSCQDQEAHESMDEKYWLEVEHGFRVLSDRALTSLMSYLMVSEMYYFRSIKFKCLRDAASFTAIPYKLSGLSTAALPDDVLLPRAGLYNGTYSVHGLELIECYFDMVHDELAFVGRKVTGDQNVPARELTFTAYVNRRLLLNEDDIASPNNLSLAVQAHEDSDFAVNDIASFRNQPFFGDHPWHWDCSGMTLDRCCGRYMSEGQIADSGFSLPAFSPQVLAVHSDKCFTLSWIELGCVSVFFRCDTQPHCDSL